MRLTRGFSKRDLVRLIVVGSACIGATLWLSSQSGAHSSPAAISDGTEQQRKDAIARAAFVEATKVFLHPRCMNCHPAGNAPLQFDDSVPHAQRVQRGPEGKGVYGMTCSACHQLANLLGGHMPPGAPNWHLPPPEMPMVFQNRTPGQLARQLKDPMQNGGKTLEELLHHVNSDPLVLWGWNPGEGRSIPPLSHAEFVSKMEEWIKNGAADPK
jgi:cytochrome c5